MKVVLRERDIYNSRLSILHDTLVSFVSKIHYTQITPTGGKITLSGIP